MLNKKLQVVIIENNAANMNAAVNVMRDCKEFTLLGACTSAVKGISLINNYSPDLIFIALDFTESDGLALAKQINKRNIYAETVLISNTSKDAYKSMESYPFDYLIRPITQNNLNQILERWSLRQQKKELLNRMEIFEHSNRVNFKRVFIQRGGIIVIPVEEIVYCKAELSKSFLMLTSGEKVPLKTSISGTLEIINSKDFIRIGRSHCINRQYLRKVERRALKCHLYYNGNTWEVPTSKGSIAELEKLISAHEQ